MIIDKSDMMKYMNYILCYVESSKYIGEPIKMYFTNNSLNDQWGDDWDDVPYEHNAGEPYEDDDHQIIKIQFMDNIVSEIITPRTNVDNSNYSVQDINNKIVPWISINFDNKSDFIYAGATFKDVINKLKLIDKDMDVYINCKLCDIM